MKIRTLSFFVTVGIFIIEAILVITSFILLDLKKKHSAIEENRFQSHYLSEELLQSSDDLTRMATSYITTGDSIYKKFYFAILDIRNGLIPRPKNYSTGYWYIDSGVPTKELLIPREGDRISLHDMMLNAGIQKKELELMTLSQARSDTLVKMELEAFAAVEGYFADSAGNYTVKKKPDFEYARSLMHSAAYQKAKANIMAPIIKLQKIVDQRTLEENRRNVRLQNIWLSISIFWGLLGLFAIFWSSVYLRRVILKPIAELYQQVSSISTGDYSFTNTIRTGNELQTLGESFNSMASRLKEWHLTLESEVKKQTEELQRLNKALSSEIKKCNIIENELIIAKEKAEMYLDTVEVIIVAFNRKSEIVLLNRKGYEILGYKTGELEGASWIKTCIPSEDMERIENYIKNVISGEIAPANFLEYAIITKSGEKRLISWNVSYFKDKDGHIDGVLCSGEDITDRRLMENQIIELNTNLELRIVQRTTELAEANESLSKEILEHEKTEAELLRARIEADNASRAKSEFLSRMSHELRTPMNAILGFAQLLELGPLAPMQRKGIDRILSGGKHLLALIDEVLDITRIDDGQMELSVEHFQLSMLIKEVMDNMEVHLADRNISLNLEKSDTGDLFINADRKKLKQALNNLIINAIKYNKEGGSVTVETKLIPLENNNTPLLKIAITDTGIGIAPEYIQKLFEPFERGGANMTTVEGLGLGLTLVQKLISTMGGTVGVESKINEGSTFWIELPYDDNPMETADELTSEKEPDAAIHSHKATMLYIEDNKDNIDLIEQIILDFRPAIQLITEIHGTSALNLALQHKPDLILLDLNLPDIHGSEVIDILHDNEKTASIPIVVISADARPPQIEELMNLGAQNYLTKPIDVLYFLKIIDEFIKDRNSRS